MFLNHQFQWQVPATLVRDFCPNWNRKEARKLVIGMTRKRPSSFKTGFCYLNRRICFLIDLTFLCTKCLWMTSSTHTPRSVHLPCHTGRHTPQTFTVPSQGQRTKARLKHFCGAWTELVWDYFFFFLFLFWLPLSTWSFQAKDQIWAEVSTYPAAMAMMDP